jgi:hypothetical protein
MTTSCLLTMSYDHLLLADHVVDQQRRGAAVVFNDDDDAFPRILDRARDLKPAVQTMNREDFATMIEDFAATMHGGERFSRGTQRHLHRCARQDESVVADADHETVDDRHGKRKLDTEGRAFAHLGRDLDLAAELLDIALHDIHADATTGDRGDFFGGREAREKNKVVDLVLRELRVFWNEVLLARLGEDFVGVDAAAIVAEFDDDIPALVVSF